MVVLYALKSDKQQKFEKGNMLKGQLVIFPTPVVYSPTKFVGKKKQRQIKRLKTSMKRKTELREQKKRIKTEHYHYYQFFIISGMILENTK